MPLLRFAFVTILMASSTSSHSNTLVAILGDSLSTGAGTHPSFQYEPQSFWDILEAKTPLTTASMDSLQEFYTTMPTNSPQMLWPTPREFHGPLEWVGSHLKRGFSMWFLNEPLYSWGSMLAHSLGYTAENVLIAAENGARIDSLPTQIDRVLHTTNRQTPEKVFIFYTGNDLCAAHPNFITKTEDFSNSLNDSLRYLTLNGSLAEQGSDIYIVAMAPVQQLVASPKVLGRKVTAYGLEMTCQQLREKSYRPDGWLKSTQGLPDAALYFKDFIPPNPALICPTLFGAPDTVDKNLSFLSGRIRNYRKVAQEAVEIAQKFAESNKKNLRFHWVESTTHMQFEGFHIANDCFHLSLEGQAYLARTVLSGLPKNEK
ncbi:MAG: SGNH/GDSL hydrolase family protein [Oligoflexales bacterium]